VSGPLLRAVDEQEMSRFEQLRAQLLDSAAVDALPPPERLLDTLLYRNTLAVLYGQPGGGKSFVALDWALCVVSGTAWLSRPVQRNRVLYIVAEGTSGLAQRKRAWQSDHPGADLTNMRWLPEALNLLDDGWAVALAELVREPPGYGLIVIDTTARSMVGGDENSAQDMGRFVAAVDRLRAGTRATVLLVHHSDKSGQTLRGSSALHGAADTVIVLKSDGYTFTLDVEKQKDAAAAEIEPLRLLPVEDSCIVVQHSHATVGIGRVDSASDSQLLRVMRESFGTTGATAAQLRDAADLPKTSFYRARNSLVSRGAIRNVGSDIRPFYVLAGGGPDA